MSASTMIEVQQSNETALRSLDDQANAWIHQYVTVRGRKRKRVHLILGGLLAFSETLPSGMQPHELLKHSKYVPSEKDLSDVPTEEDLEFLVSYLKDFVDPTFFNDCPIAPIISVLALINAARCDEDFRVLRESLAT